MMQAILVAFTGLILASSVTDDIDESLLRGTWAWGAAECGSDRQITYRDGMLGNPIPETHELHKHGDFYPIFKVVSAKRKGDEASIQFRSILSDNGPVYAVLFRIEENRYVAIRASSTDPTENSDGQISYLSWKRCEN